MVDPADEKEWRKTITSVLEPGNTLVFIDEVSTLRSASLGAALTAGEHEGRRLGQTEMIRVPQRATWIVAGNNVQLAGDLPRRAYRIRLDPKMARPWLRSGFRHDDLEGWACEHRGELLAALLTLARAWHAAGQPAANVPVLGSFGPWARTVGGILQHAGVEDFLGNLAELYDENDEEARAWEGFLRAVAEIFDGREFPTSALHERIENSEALAGALPDDLADKRDRRSFRQVLGKALRKHVDTRHGEDGIRVTQTDEDTKNKTPKWRIAVDLSLRESGSAGSSLTPTSHDAQAGAHGETGAKHSATPALPQGRRWPEMASKPSRAPAAEIRLKPKTPALALTVEQACDALSIGYDTWKERVEPEIRLVAFGRRKVIPVVELERWLDAHAENVLERR